MSEAKPWDLFNPNIGRVSATIKEERMAICDACPELIPVVKQCSICHCFMLLKTELPNASCPKGLWKEVN